MLQFVALAKAANEGLPVDDYDGFQDSCHGLCQWAEGLFRRREETLEFGDGGRPLLTFGNQRPVAADGFRPGVSGFFLYCRRERASGERLTLDFRRSERGPLNVERLPGDLDRLLEPSVCLPSLFKAPPQEAVAFCGIVAVIPSPQPVDHDGEIGGRPVDQCSCRK
jgi:hypothetical protein